MPPTAWSADDDRRLRKLLDALPGDIEFIANALGRTPAAVRTRAKKLAVPASSTPKPSKKAPGRRGQIKSGRREDLEGLFVRSSWEANYARYLNLRKEGGYITGWEFEPVTFKFPVQRGNKSYTPDFRVWLPDGEYEWHEVKGWMDKDSKVKLKRFALHYPEESIRLKIIDRAVYRQIHDDYASLLAWE